MKIEVKRSGGVAGLRLPPVTVDSDRLPADDARKLQELIGAADFFNLPPKSPTPPRGADRIQYTVAVDTGDRRHQVQLSEDQMPEGLQRLVDWLAEARARLG
jgi:hypothetical protein